MYELLKKRRSIRKFKNKEVEKEKLDLILNSGLLSPSSRGRKPWEFIVVTDPQMLRNLSESREHSSGFLKGAPVGIVVVADPELCDVWIEDCSIASVIIQLTAHSLGLGSCWIQVRERIHSQNMTAEDYIKENLLIPSKYKVESIVAIGYPDEEKNGYEESDLLFDKLHYNKY